MLAPERNEMHRSEKDTIFILYKNLYFKIAAFILFHKKKQKSELQWAVVHTQMVFLQPISI